MSGFGGPEVLDLTEVAVPDVGPHEVLVEVEAVGVNRIDLATMRREGLAHGVQLGHVPGIDPAGTVVEVGDSVIDRRVGERVVVRPVIACGTCVWCTDGHDDSCDSLAYVGVHRPGGFAEFVAVPSDNAHPIPEALTFAEAAAFSHSFPVALQMLRERAQVGEGDTVLVTGAAGAVGVAAVQMAKHLGARVIAAAGSSVRAERCLGFGADLAIDYGSRPRFAEEVRDFAPTGVSACIETTGAPHLWEQVVSTMGKRGQIVVCGAHVGGQVALDLFWLFRTRVSITGSAASTRAAFVNALATFSEQGMIAPVHCVVPLAEFHRAFDLLGNRDRVGEVGLGMVRTSA